ncbi:MAG: phage minor capsid protein [Oscillospiraceae bacterium]|jgi:hypothetical protein|nr:phage minor capsid protein [Oscillospiraceae bacterium]
MDAEKLARLYLEARLRLFDKIINSGVGTKVWANELLQSLEAEIAALQEQTGVFIDTAIPAEYQKGLDAVYDYFTRKKLTMRRPDMFAQIHADAVHGLTREMQHNIGSALINAGRQVQRYLDPTRAEILRRIGLEQTAIKMASGGTVAELRRNLIDRLTDEGFMTVQYGEGVDARQVPLDVYASMVARTTSREAGNLSRENQLTENGYDLMQMTEHYPTCAKCARLQGRVFSISGKDKRFPALSTAFAAGYHTVHPNCRHVLVPFIESLLTPDELAAVINKSNAAMVDTRDKAQIDLYETQQRENRQYRQEMYQYERYKARLGNDAPKTLAAFRRQKHVGEAWEENTALATRLEKLKAKGAGGMTAGEKKELAALRRQSSVAKKWSETQLKYRRAGLRQSGQ